MRTLKKSLCLVLALVFVLGLCTFGSNAAYAKYTDIAKVDYTQAVEVLTGLGVIEGYPDGTFMPTGDVTRAEAAAMIARMMLGREDADKLPVGDVKFSDVPETNWAAKYIAFCANRGIIVGMGDGTFHPSENVTGTQMATMLLRALGYGVMGEYEGKGWDINAVADALYYGVFKDSKVTDFNNAATREETALYVWNTMRIQLVGYDVDLNYYDGKWVDRYQEVPLTFARSAFNLIEYKYAVLLANQATGNNYTVVRTVDGYRVEYIDEERVNVPVYDDINLAIDTDLDMIGHEVTVYYKADIKEDKVNHCDYHEAYLVIDESTVLNKGFSYDDFYRAAKAANKANQDVEFATVPTWTNYDYNQTGYYGKVTDYNSMNYATFTYDIEYEYVYELKGQKATLDWSFFWISGTWILDHEGKIMLVLKNNYRVGEVKNVDTTHEEVEVKLYAGRYGLKNYPDIYDLKWNDIELVYDGIEKGDYVVVQPVGDLFYVKPTTTQTIEVTERYSSMGSWYFNGIGPDSYGNGITIEDQDDPADVGVGDKVLLYMTESGYFGLEILEKAKSEGIVYVNYVGEFIDHSDWDEWSSKISTAYKVQCINQDGEEVVYRVNDTSFATVKEGTVCEVFVRNGYATFEELDTDYCQKKEEGRNSYLKSAAGDIYFVTDDTNIIYFTGTGADLKISVSNKFADGEYDVYTVAKKSGGNYKLTTVWVPNQKAPASYGDSIMFIENPEFSGFYSCDGYELFDESEDPYYEVYIDGEQVRVHLTGDDSLFKKDSVKSGFYQFKVNAKGQYVIGAVTEDVYGMDLFGGTGTVLTKGSVKNGKLYANGSDGVALKCEFVDVSGCTTIDTKTDTAINSLDRLEELLEEGYKVYVTYMYTVSSKNEVPVGVMYIYWVINP